MTNSISAVILSKTQEKTEKFEATRKLPTRYIERMLAFDTVFCYKCGLPIIQGMRYESNSGTGTCANHFRKYYHEDCKKKLYL